MSEDIKKQLGEMAQLSLLANRISEVQEKNMKMFPFCFFEDVSNAEIDYDLGHGVDEKTKQVNHSSFVTYRLKLNPSSNEKNLQKRLQALESSIRNLFWKDIVVKVYFNGNLVYESKDV